MPVKKSPSSSSCSLASSNPSSASTDSVCITPSIESTELSAIEIVDVRRVSFMGRTVKAFRGFGGKPAVTPDFVPRSSLARSPRIRESSSSNHPRYGPSSACSISQMPPSTRISPPISPPIHEYPKPVPTLQPDPAVIKKPHFHSASRISLLYSPADDSEILARASVNSSPFQISEGVGKPLPELPLVDLDLSDQPTIDEGGSCIEDVEPRKRGEKIEPKCAQRSYKARKSNTVTEGEKDLEVQQGRGTAKPDKRTRRKSLGLSDSIFHLFGSSPISPVPPLPASGPHSPGPTLRNKTMGRKKSFAASSSSSLTLEGARLIHPPLVVSPSVALPTSTTTPKRASSKGRLSSPRTVHRSKIPVLPAFGFQPSGSLVTANLEESPTPTRTRVYEPSPLLPPLQFDSFAGPDFTSYVGVSRRQSRTVRNKTRKSSVRSTTRPKSMLLMSSVLGAEGGVQRRDSHKARDSRIRAQRGIVSSPSLPLDIMGRIGEQVESPGATGSPPSAL